MGAHRRVEFRFDPATEEGQIIAAWLRGEPNVARALRDLVVRAASGQSSQRRLEELVAQAAERGVERAVSRTLDGVCAAPVTQARPEDPNLARTIDDLF